MNKNVVLEIEVADERHCQVQDKVFVPRCPLYGAGGCCVYFGRLEQDEKGPLRSPGCVAAQIGGNGAHD